MVRKIILGIVLILGFAACKRSLKDDPAQRAAVYSFYKAIMVRKDGGIPGGKDIARLKPRVSSRFYKLLVAGNEAEDLYARKTNNEIPPLIEGSFFFFLFEGADRILSFSPQNTNGQCSYLIEFEYGTTTKENEFTRWKDRTILVRESNKWVVDDIELLGNWQFASHGKLSDILGNVIKEANEAWDMSSSPKQSLNHP